MQFARFAGICSVALLILTGCGSSDSSPQSQAAEPLGDFSGTVAILPAAELSYLSGEFSFIYPQVDADLRAWLVQQNIRVASSELVQRALETNGGALLTGLKSSKPEDMSKAITDLIWKLRDQETVDVLIVPQIMVRSTVLEQPYSGATWDGVQRNFVVFGDRNSGSPLQVDRASLVVGVYNRYGQAIYFGQGGLDFLDNGTRAGSGIYSSPKQPGQISAAHVQEAINLAMTRWVSEYQKGPYEPAYGPN